MDERQERPEGTIDARFRRTALTRVAHIDGAWGGLTPSGDILMALYSERVSLPETTSYEVLSSGRAVQRPNEPAEMALLRDIELEAVMSVEVAQALVEWLTVKITEGRQYGSRPQHFSAD